MTQPRLKTVSYLVGSLLLVTGNAQAYTQTKNQSNSNPKFSVNISLKPTKKKTNTSTLRKTPSASTQATPSNQAPLTQSAASQTQPSTTITKPKSEDYTHISLFENLPTQNRSRITYSSDWESVLDNMSDKQFNAFNRRQDFESSDELKEYIAWALAARKDVIRKEYRGSAAKIRQEITNDQRRMTGLLRNGQIEMLMRACTYAHREYQTLYGHRKAPLDASNESTQDETEN